MEPHNNGTSQYSSEQHTQQASHYLHHPQPSSHPKPLSHVIRNDSSLFSWSIEAGDEEKKKIEEMDREVEGN